MPLSGLDGFAEEALGQARFFERRDLPCYASLLREAVALFAAEAPLRERVEAAWSARSFAAVYERPLLLCAALRLDALAAAAHPLHAALADLESSAGVVDRSSLRAALAEGAPALGALARRAVQTNEITRAITWRLVHSALAAAVPEVVLVDLGCSAGLNLVADQLPLAWHDSDGAPLALAPTGNVRARLGLDRAPIDVRGPDEVAWLRACLWPGQRLRHERLDLAVAAARKAALDLRVVDAAAMPATLAAVAAAHPDAVVLAYQTVFVEYLPPATRAAYEAAMTGWLAQYPGRALWARLESTIPPEPTLPAALELDRAVGERVERYRLARCEFHPLVLQLDRQALAAAVAGLRPSAA
jgi:hypothetical protein